MRAQDWLALTVCEPALGSGAFANEAISQLAARYLKAAQRECGERIDPDRYPIELQRAKAHFAINRTYGVDLNGTAVELAEVSLWLNVMHPGLAAPRFDARLRRGNSLIGARRATYTREQVMAAPWKGTSTRPVVPPTEHPLHDTPLGQDVGIHHFLLPGEGWGAASDAPDLRGTRSAAGLVAEWSSEVREWKARVQRPPQPKQLNKLRGLSLRVEQAWVDAAAVVAEKLRARQQRTGVWATTLADLPAMEAGRSASDVTDPEGPLARLRLVMDAWCALWLWAPEHGAELPELDDWIDATEMLLGQRAEESGTLFSLREMKGAEYGSVRYFGTSTVPEALERHPWLQVCCAIAKTQAFFHWELEFAPVFEAGGFDIQIGNPPWVRLRWDEAASLAEHDAWWGVVDLAKTPDQRKQARRSSALDSLTTRADLVSDLAEISGLSALLGARTREPYLLGIQTNLYMHFMTNTWRRSGAHGVVGLIHPESHFADPSGGPIREPTYSRLRRHWQFSNETKLFQDVHNETEFGVHVYGGPRTPQFLQAANLLAPSTLDRSLDHDGTGDLPSIQYPEGGWDLRPHAQRIVTVNYDVLTDWVGLFDPTGTPAQQSRLLRPLTRADLSALAAFARQPWRLGDMTRYWSRGFDEVKLKTDGTAEWNTAYPAHLEDCILQGPHAQNATPFAQQPRENCASNRDWEALDLERVSAGFVPRTNYQRLVSQDEFQRRQTAWDGKPYSMRYREAHREFVSAGLERTMKAFILPPGPPHIYTINSIALEDDASTALLAALFSSLPYDYLVKVFGVGHLIRSVTDVIPMASLETPLRGSLLLRVLRLNAMTQHYEQLWWGQFEEGWAVDAFVSGRGTVQLGAVGHRWSTETPLRTDLDRWLALTEIDAIVALMLGLTEEQLVQMYRSQFAVLRKYEFVTVFDANGRQISGIHHNYGFHQRQWEDELKAAPVRRGERKVGMWDRVHAYLKGDTEVDLGPFVPPFVPADRELAMSRAYRAFEARLAAS